MNNSKIVVTIGILIMFILAFTMNLSAQDDKKKEAVQAKTVKEVKEDASKTNDSMEDWQVAQENGNKKLKKYKKKGKKKKKAKKKYGETGNASGKTKDKEGKAKVDEAKKQRELSKDERDKAMSAKEKERAATIKRTPSVEVAPAGGNAKTTQEQIRELETRIEKMKNIMATKELSDDAKRKYNERISEYQKELSALRVKQESTQDADQE